MATQIDEVQNLIVRSGSLTLGTPDYLGPVTTLTASTPSANRTYTIPDAGNDSSFILSKSSSGTQTIDSQLIVTKTLGLLAPSNQLIIWPNGTGNYYSINAASPSGQRTINLPSDIALPAYMSLSVDRCDTISAAATLQTANSGQTLLIQNTDSSYDITLPAPLQGVNYKFFLLNSPVAAITITAGSALIVGSLLSSDGTGVTGGNITSPITNIIIGTDAKAGDSYSFFGSGSQWYITGITSDSSSVTVS